MSRTSHPEVSDVVVEKINDPAIAASLVTLLDNAELLSTLVLGLAGFIERGDVIMDSLADSVTEFKAARSAAAPGMPLPKLSDLVTVTQELTDAAPTLRSVLNSSMVRPETVELLSLLSEAATEGATRAQLSDTKVSAIGAVKALRDDDVQRGLGLVIEIARSLGQKLRD